jgi:ABC-type bacteriocin/lantibiotic exporter with double-glycine peptidase domain
MILSLVVSIADILSLAFLFFVINFYTPQSVALNISFISKFGIHAHSILPAVFLLIAFAAKSLGGYYVYRAQQKFVNNVSSRISGTNLLKYMEGSFEDHVNIDSAAFIQKIYHQPIEFANYVLSSVQQIVTESILVILSITALLIYSAKLLLIVSLVLLPAIAILSYITKRRLTGIRKNIKAVHEKSLQYLNEALTGFVESNIYDKNKQFVGRYQVLQSLLNNYIADMQITQGLPSRFFEAFAVFGLFILIIAGLYGGTENATDIFKLGAFVAAAYKIIPGISKIINFGGMIKTYKYILPELKNDNSITGKKEKQNTENIKSIEFRNLHFSYKDSHVLSDLNFKISKGSFIGISGNSGRGKTTLINILLGFLNPTTGEIFINEKKSEASERKIFWRQIAHVKQEAFIIHDSIVRNITLLEDNFDPKKLDHAIEVSQLKEVVDQFPEGINKIISQDGKNISGGQRQRIAIARALYKDADLIILDEPFNELDETSEVKLMHYFKCLSQKGKIIILITHNSKSLSFCDEVINLDEQ